MRYGQAMRSSRPLTLLTATAAAVLLTAAITNAAWDGRQEVRLGDQITAEFAAAPLMEVHDYSFWVPKGTVLSATCVVDAGSNGLVPDMAMFDEMDVSVPFGAAQTGNTVKKYTFVNSGEYYLKIRATAGTGVYRLGTKAKFPKTVAGPETTGTFQFDAMAGTVASVLVKPTKGSTAAPDITALTYAGGSIDLALYAKKAATTGAPRTKLTKVLLPVDGTYTLAIDPGTAGQSVDVKVTLLAPKTGRFWAPGVVEDPSGLQSSNREKWLESPHADHTALPFNDWNDTATQMVPGNCSRCHTTTGYQSYVGLTGTQYATPADQPIGQVITCDACHNDATAALTSVKFPSGTTVSDLGTEARCMMCHQGRESTTSVEAKITTAAPGTVDDAMTGVGFMNVHYLAAGATLYGDEALGAYEYADPAKADPLKYYAIQGTTLQPRVQYDRKFTHVGSKDTCTECHDPHSTELKIAAVQSGDTSGQGCAACHVNKTGNPVATKDDLHDIRMAGTTADFDGNGQKQGVYFEIAGMRSILLTALQDYTVAVFNKKIAYDANAYPYFFLDTDGDGVVDPTEAVSANKFPNWSARSLRAAYNYQFSVKDPGAYAHNAKYIIEILYDSIADLNLKVPVANFANLVRNDANHFDGAAEPYTDWTEDAIPSTAPPGGRGSTTGTDQMVNANCSRCHSVEGFDYIVASGTQTTFVPSPRINGMNCESCHVDGANFAPRAQNTTPDQFGNKTPGRVYVARVAFPYQEASLASTSGTPSPVLPSTQAQIAAVTIFNGAPGTSGQDDSFVCMTCHRARTSTLTLNATIAADSALGANFTLSASNSHYLGAGATMYGSKAAVMYQYPGKTYVQRWDHDLGYTTPYALNSGVPVTAAAKAQCTYCHMQGGNHSFEVEVGPATACGMCHPATSVDQLAPFGRAEDNYDNDPATKPKAELAVFQARLLTAIQNYSAAANIAGKTGATYVVYDAAQNSYWFVDTNKDGIRQSTETSSPKFDAKALRATFNYNFSIKEPGSWAHNPKFVLQELYDSIEDLGGDLTNLVRPN